MTVCLLMVTQIYGAISVVEVVEHDCIFTYSDTDLWGDFSSCKELNMTVYLLSVLPFYGAISLYLTQILGIQFPLVACSDMRSHSTT